MSKEVIIKKLEQIKNLLREMEELLTNSLDEFVRDFKILRAAERDFQLIVDLASDINTDILLEKGRAAPASYRQSFLDLAGVGAINYQLAKILSQSARLRNILVHEYDFDVDIKKFYYSAEELSPYFGEYIKAILNFLK